MEGLARTFRALADPTRLRIVNLLLTAPGCVCELQAVLDLPQPLMSRHLSHLRNAELVDDEREGMRVRYRLRCESQTTRELRRFLAETLARDERLRREAESWTHFQQGSAVVDEKQAVGMTAAR